MVEKTTLLTIFLVVTVSLVTLTLILIPMALIRGDRGYLLGFGFGRHY